VTTEEIKPNAVDGKKRAMPEKEDDVKSTIMKGLKLKKQELVKTLYSFMKAPREYEGQLTAGDLIEAARGLDNKESQRIDYLLSRAAEEQDFGLWEECGLGSPGNDFSWCLKRLFA
jgi:hypothetical protein